MNEKEPNVSTAEYIDEFEPCLEAPSQPSPGLRRKSVENLLVSSHDVIGSSISSSITLGTMTLPTNCPGFYVSSPDSLEQRSHSPSASPQSSPRQHHRRDHSRSNYSSSGSFKDTSPSLLDKPDVVEDNVSRSSDSGGPPVLELSRSLSHESNKDRKESSRNSDRSKKKSSWYNALYPTYKSRSEDFRRIFKDVPPEERLVVDYSCALQKDILVHGRLYVSQNYLCFYANIFRWETLVSLKWKDVTAITKEKTALVIPNAVLVCTETDKLFFTSFGARDKTYLMLFRVWQNALMDQQMSMQEMWQWVHSCYGEELGLTSDDEDYIHPVLEEDKISNIGVPLSVDSFVEEFTESPLELPVDCHLDDSLPGLLYRHQQVSPHSPGKRVPGIASISLLSENLPTDMSDTTDSDADKHGGKGEAVVCSSQHEGRKIVRSIFPVHIDQLFTLLFTSSKFFLDFHTIRRTSDMNLSPWQQSPDSGLKQRVVTLTMPLSQSVGPKSTHVCETQIMLPCSKPGQLYAIDSDSVNSGIPYADSFYVTTHYCISRTGENECCLAVYCQIKYKKNVWGIVKSFIEKNTWSGLEDFHTSLTKALQVECDSGIGLGVKKKVRRRRRGLAGITPAEVARPIIGLVEGDGRTLSEMLSWGVMAILVFLVCLNALLYYKLWVLEEWTQNSSHSFTVMDLQVLRTPPKSQDEWLRLLQQQEALHNVEMQKWQKVLQAAVQLLRQTEESLSELQVSIHPLVSKKVLSVLKDTFAEEAAAAEALRGELPAEDVVTTETSREEL